MSHSIERDLLVFLTGASGDHHEGRGGSIMTLYPPHQTPKEKVSQKEVYDHSNFSRHYKVAASQATMALD
ncbi:hypothetical protein Pmani_002073 [Petrolisthes manimaculis]|uniref:Uncharacterized protein n=1 Tax=Petrolisthes manimaculis TaxID=1843537 RepID=A0AAE1UJN2_9EUCA|nr:hypothetical protein Pmani_002073 [Petrolisthes manimaculis]